MADGHTIVHRTPSASHAIPDEEHAIEEHLSKEKDTGSHVNKTGLQLFWHRFQGKGRKKVGVIESLKNILLSSCECLMNFRSILFTQRSLLHSRVKCSAHPHTFRMDLLFSEK